MGSATDFGANVSAMKRLQSMLYVINTIFLLIGVLLTSIGSTIHAVYNEFEVFIGCAYFRPVIIVIMVGVIMIVQSATGYIGIAKKSTSFVSVYIFLLSFLLIFELSAAILGFVMSPDIYENIKSNMFTGIQNYRNDDYTRDSWDFTQEKLHCCGVLRPVDWATLDIQGANVTLEGQTFSVPSSCCRDHTCKEIYARGCLSILGAYGSDSITMIGCCSTVVFIIQIFGIIFACMLVKAIRHTKTVQEKKRQEKRHAFFTQLAYEQPGKVFPLILYTPSSSEA